MYYLVRNNEVVEYSNTDKYIDNPLFIDNLTMEEYSKDKDKYIVVDGVLELNPDYDKIVEEREKTRIASLTCTKRVLALALKQLGVSYTQLKELIATDEDAQLEWDLCGSLLRSNPFIDSMGSKLGIDSTTIDKIFRIANGEKVDG